MKLRLRTISPSRIIPAAFRRLCVETKPRKFRWQVYVQPPSGGCVLKQDGLDIRKKLENQPPSGGCVLKQNDTESCDIQYLPAAFRRLCVETDIPGKIVNFEPSSRLQAAVC